MQLRLNSADDPIAGEPERVTENGTEYLTTPVAASQEQILAYEDTPNAHDREFLPGDELSTGAARTNTATATLNHPLVASASGGIQTCLTSTPGAQYASVGEFRDLRMNNTETKLLGELWLPVDERDEHGAEYRDAFDTLENGGEVGVSLGYAPGEVDPTPGRYNGERYDAIQRAPEIDHLALITSGEPRCSVEAGCAAGRANADPIEAAVGVPAVTDGGTATDNSTMSNQQHPEQDKGRIASALGTLGSAFGIDVETRPRANARSSARTPEYDATLAESDMGPDEYVSTHWNLGDYIDAYAEQTGEDVPADVHSPLSGGISQEAREWIASHTLLGNADAETEPNLLLFDVVSPDGVLHESKLRDVIGEDGARATLPDELREAARDEAGRLLDEEFDDGDDDQDGTGDDTDRENATQYSAGDIVEYTSGGRTGVVLEVYTSDFDWPQGEDEDDDLEIDASNSSPMYVIGRETGGSGLYRGSELAKGEFDEDVPAEGEIADLRQNATVPAWYADVDADEREDVIRGNANIPGVDDPEVGFASLPDGWTRKSVLQAYASLGGSFTSCRTQMRGEVRSPTRFCAALKDEVWGSERATRMNARVEERAAIEQSDSRAGESGRGADTTQDTMQDPDTPDDDQMIDYLANETDFDRENAEKLRGEDCLALTYERFNSEAETETDGGEGGAETETTESAETPAEPGSEETSGNTPNGPAVTFESEEEFEDKVADIVESRENAKEEESLIDWIDSRSERYNAEMLDGTPAGVLEEIADDVAGEQRENATMFGAGGVAGEQPQPGQADRSPMQTSGGPRLNAETDDLPPSSDDESYEAATANSGGDD